MKKLSSYQKLKAERNQMGLDLLEIITNPDSHKSILIKMKYSTMARIEKALWFGDSTNDDFSKGYEVTIKAED